MTSFDLESLLDFDPAEFYCPTCYALLSKHWNTVKDGCHCCPVCNDLFEQANPNLPLTDFLKKYRWNYEFNDQIQHAKQMASVARRFRTGQSEDDVLLTPIKTLFDSISKAQHFIHFTTFGIDAVMLGALAIVAQTVRVRGIVSLFNSDARILSEIQQINEDCEGFSFRGLEIKAIIGSDPKWKNLPHQKIVIIDGLIAFKGSANLTTTAWRKASDGRELIEVVTKTEEVIDLHNRFFAAHWLDARGNNS